MFFLFKLQYDREYGQELGTSKEKKKKKNKKKKKKKKGFKGKAS